MKANHSETNNISIVQKKENIQETENKSRNPLLSEQPHTNNPFLPKDAKSVNPFLPKDAKSVNPFLPKDAKSVNPFLPKDLQTKENTGKEKFNSVVNTNISESTVQKAKDDTQSIETDTANTTLASPQNIFQFKDKQTESVMQQKVQDSANTQNSINSEQPKVNNTGLPNQLKSGIENISGYAMDDVKVHYNSPKPAQLQAHAYAQGADIHIAPGQEKHLPHEAWHIVQQKQGRVKPTLQMKGKVAINDDQELEKEANAMGVKALRMNTTVVENQNNPIQTKSTVQLQEKAQEEKEKNMIEKEGGATQAKLKHAPISNDVAQLAYTAKRPLMGWLHAGMGEAVFEDKGLFHHHIFFEDGKDPSNIGFTDTGIFQDTPEMMGKYVKDSQKYDDTLMREAVKNVGDPGEYKATGYNCQRYVRFVLIEYHKLKEEKDEKKSNFFNTLFDSKSESDASDDEKKAKPNFFETLFDSKSDDETSDDEASLDFFKKKEATLHNDNNTY